MPTPVLADLSFEVDGERTVYAAFIVDETFGVLCDYGVDLVTVIDVARPVDDE